MSLGTTNRDGGKTSESGHLRTLYAAFGSGVIGGLKIVQRGAGANMSVDVPIGDCIVGRSDLTYGHDSFNDAVLNKVVTTADPTNPRRDIVVFYIDYTVTPSTGVSNNTNGVAAVKIVAGTPAGSPVDPSDASIQASVGASNPWIKLARVRVGAGVTSIGNSVIDDLRTLINPRLDTVSNIISSEIINNHVASGCVWSADAPGSTLNASMTSGVVYIAGKRLTVAAVVARGFTLSKDTYVYLTDNGDGTAAFTYTANTTNAASPSLPAGAILIAIIVAGATNIASAANVNNGNVSTTAPTAPTVSGRILLGTDSLGNAIGNRNPAAPGAAATAYIATSEALNNGAYSDLATVGPVVSTNIGKSGVALVTIYCNFVGNASASFMGMSFAISGATTVAAADPFAIFSVNTGGRWSGTFFVPNLVPGLNTFTAKYKTGASFNFSDRKISVAPQ